MLSRVLQPGDRLLAAIPTNGPLEYYLDRFGVNPAHLSLDEKEARRILVVVDGVEGQTLDRVTERSEARDSTRFGPPAVIATFLASTIHLYQRRDGPTK